MLSQCAFEAPQKDGELDCCLLKTQKCIYIYIGQDASSKTPKRCWLELVALISLRTPSNRTLPASLCIKVLEGGSCRLLLQDRQGPDDLLDTPVVKMT